MPAPPPAKGLKRPRSLHRRTARTPGGLVGRPAEPKATMGRLAATDARRPRPPAARLPGGDDATSIVPPRGSNATSTGMSPERKPVRASQSVSRSLTPSSARRTSVVWSTTSTTSGKSQSPAIITFGHWRWPWPPARRTAPGSLPPRSSAALFSAGPPKNNHTAICSHPYVTKCGLCSLATWFRCPRSTFRSGGAGWTRRPHPCVGPRRS